MPDWDPYDPRFGAGGQGGLRLEFPGLGHAEIAEQVRAVFGRTGHIEFTAYDGHAWLHPAGTGRTGADVLAQWERGTAP